MKQTPLEHRLSQIIAPLLADAGLSLVLLSMIQGEGKSGRTLQILAENPATGSLDLDACQNLSRAIGTHLEVEDVIPGAYRLEISSPGIDRPLTRLADYDTYAGFEIKIELAEPVGTQKRFHGKILGSGADNTVRLETDTGPVALPFEAIEKSKLKLTDALIEFSRRRLLAATVSPTPDDESNEEGVKCDDRTAAGG